MTKTRILNPNMSFGKLFHSEIVESDNGIYLNFLVRVVDLKDRQISLFVHLSTQGL